MYDINRNIKKPDDTYEPQRTSDSSKIQAIDKKGEIISSKLGTSIGKTRNRITIVTAFFDIGRAASEVFARTNEDYFAYFDFWARIQNDMIIYCAPKDVVRIRDIRKKYNRDNTIIIPIADIYIIESDIYQQMKRVEGLARFKEFRFAYTAMSNRSDYTYLMMLKYWFLQDAAKKYVAVGEEVSWIDFGYNHGGEHYTDPNDFDFRWDYCFDDKINLFCLSDPDCMVSIDSLQFQKDCFIGHSVICRRELTGKLWEYIKTAMRALLSLDCIDDDQQLLLMLYRMHKDECTIRVCGWFEDMALCSNQKFKVRPPSLTSTSEGYEAMKKDFLTRCSGRVNRYYP